MHLQLLYVRMESTEKCEAIIQHFNGKYIKTPPGVAGTTSGLFFILSFVLTRGLWQINNEWYVVIKCPQNPCCVNLRMGDRRNVRIRGNITRMGGSGRERARLWESYFFQLFSCWFQPQVLIHSLVLSLIQGGMTLTYDPTPALQNGCVQKLLLKRCCAFYHDDAAW